MSRRAVGTAAWVLLVMTAPAVQARAQAIYAKRAAFLKTAWEKKKADLEKKNKLAELPPEPRIEWQARQAGATTVV